MQMKKMKPSPINSGAEKPGWMDLEMTPANDNHPKYTGPFPPSREAAQKCGSRWFMTWTPCSRGHVSPRQARDGKCAICVWHHWEGVRRRKGAKPFQPNLARRAAEQLGERYFDGDPCPHGHDGQRWTHNGACVECTMDAAREFHRSPEGQAYTKAWRISNSDKVREYNRNMKSKRKGAEGTHTAADIRRLLELQKSKCAECGTSVRKRSDRHVDHIVPLSKGGTNWPNNLQILCVKCNLEKNNKDPLEWARMKGRLL